MDPVLFTMDVLAIGVVSVTLGIAIYLGRWHRAETRKIRAMREEFLRTMTFTAWMSTEESGAPPEVRAMARQALPKGAVVEVEAVEDEPPPVVH